MPFVLPFDRQTKIFIDFCSMDQLDDDQIEQLMLESDGFDILEDSNLAPKSWNKYS